MACTPFRSPSAPAPTPQASRSASAARTPAPRKDSARIVSKDSTRATPKDSTRVARSAPLAAPRGTVVTESRGALVADTVFVTRIVPRDSAREPVRDTNAIRVSPDTVAKIVDALHDASDLMPSLELDEYAGHERVEHYLRLFAGTASVRIGERLSAGTRYSAMIRAKLRAAGIPEDFRYLALIESGFDPDAYSRAAAVGMWQFMTSTAKGTGLRVDWWIDERRDAARATDAAIKFLNSLRDQFGSYYLAAAAYNGGPGRISRSLSRLAEELEDDEPEDKFFTLASSTVLRAETRNYVPQIIAAALIGRDPSAYGITVDTQPPFVYDSVRVPPATGLSVVAKLCDAEVATIVDLNRHVLRGMTPPDGPDTQLRIPLGCGASFGGAFAAMDSLARRGATVRKSKKGETPASVAKNAGITVAQLRTFNPKVKTAMNAALPIGTRLLLPKKETVRAARGVPDPSIERYGVASGGVYVVRRGDTLGGIALRNHTTVSAIKRNNRLRSDVIFAGQKLRIGG